MLWYGMLCWIDRLIETRGDRGSIEERAPVFTSARLSRPSATTAGSGVCACLPVRGTSDFRNLQ